MKLIRLQSGPLACVYQDEDVAATSEARASGFYRAFSGSVEAAGASETEALAALDRNLRHLSGPPSGPIEQTESVVALADANDRRDTDHCQRPLESRPSLARCGAPDTVRSLCPSSLPAIAFALAR